MTPVDLTHITWLGGSPCAGKSSIAEAICAKDGWHYYKCDDYVNTHLTRSSPQTAPTVHHLHALSCDDLWMRPVAEQVRTEIAYCAELFTEILTDLRALPTDRPILAEGASLLPSLVAPLLTRTGQAIWLVPTPAFQRAHYAQRPWIHDILADCRDPEAAFAHWMARDEAFARWILAQTAELGLARMVIDGKSSLRESIAAVQYVVNA